MIHCYYHSVDLDGHCSGAIVKEQYPDVNLVPIDYYQMPRWEEIQPEDTVFIVDFSFPPEIMQELSERTKAVIWLDHHKTAVEDPKHNHSLLGIRETGIAGCGLTWQYCFPDRPMPLAVKLLSDYDIWHHEDPKCLPFQYGMRLHDTRPDQFNWTPYFTDTPELLEKTMERGKTVLDYQEALDQKMAGAAAFETVFEGHKAICINACYVNSNVFNSVRKPHHEVLIAFFLQNDGKWKHTLYSAGEVNVGGLAKKYGGGGHAGAAGFTIKKLAVHPKGQGWLKRLLWGLL